MDRLHAEHASVSSHELVEQIAETNRLENEMKTGGTWAACFRGINLRRTEIAIVSWTSPALVGFVVSVLALPKLHASKTDEPHVRSSNVRSGFLQSPVIGVSPADVTHRARADLKRVDSFHDILLHARRFCRRQSLRAGPWELRNVSSRSRL